MASLSSPKRRDYLEVQLVEHLLRVDFSQPAVEVDIVVQHVLISVD